MGLGSTAKKVQQMVDMAEELYKKLNELREQIVALRETVENTSERVERLERENAKQEAVLAALAEKQGVDVESVVADVETSGPGSDTEVEDASAGTTAQSADNNP